MDRLVLVAGAGPVGMMAALELRRKGVRVEIFDQEDGPTTRSYACLLHPLSVRLLHKVGMGDEVLSRGARVDCFSLVENGSRKHDLRFSNTGPSESFAVILPQCDLEGILQRGLAAYGVEIQWRNRVTDIHDDGRTVTLTIDRLWNSVTGYAVPHMDVVVRKTFQRSAPFLIAADGRDSHAREILGINRNSIGDPEFFATYEFETEGWPSDDLYISIHDKMAHLFTRLPNGRARWLFQCAPEDLDIETHLKDRLHFQIIDPANDNEFLAELRDRVAAHAPGFQLDATRVDNHGVIEFPKSLVSRFGQGRCWLAGDAAHTASPIGMHSMNLGLAEAVDLAQIIAGVLNGTGNLDQLGSFDSKFGSLWRNLFEIPDKRNRMLAQALPASGEELGLLLAQLGTSISKQAFAPNPSLR